MTGKQRKYLRGLAHALRPAVQIGARGLTESVLRQVDQALADHELIKVKVSGDSAVGRDETAGALCSRLGCDLAGSIGHVVILYRADAENPRIRLPADTTAADEAAGGE